MTADIDSLTATVDGKTISCGERASLHLVADVDMKSAICKLSSTIIGLQRNSSEEDTTTTIPNQKVASHQFHSFQLLPLLLLLYLYLVCFANTFGQRSRWELCQSLMRSQLSFPC